MRIKRVSPCNTCRIFSNVWHTVGAQWMPFPSCLFWEPTFGIDHKLQWRFLPCKLSLKHFYLPFLSGDPSWTLPPLPLHSISVMTDHQIIRAASTWNCVSSLMIQFLSAWPSTEQSMCFFRATSPGTLGLCLRWLEEGKGNSWGVDSTGNPSSLPCLHKRPFRRVFVSGGSKRKAPCQNQRCGCQSWLLCI